MDNNSIRELISALENKNDTKLGSDNYFTWAAHMEGLLFENELWEVTENEFIITTTEKEDGTTITSPSANEIKKRLKTNMKAYSMILRHLDHENTMLICDSPELKGDPYKTWMKLKEKHAEVNQFTKAAAYKSLNDLTYTTDLKTFINDIRKVLRNLRNAKISYEGDTVATQIIMKLPDQYQTTAQNILASGKVTMMNVLAVLEQTSKFHNLQDNQSNESKTSKALIADSSKTETSKSRERKPRKKCTYCNKTGHLESECWEKVGKPSWVEQRDQWKKEMAEKNKKTNESAMMAYNQYVLISSIDNNTNLKPILDSGATSTMIRNRKYFWTYQSTKFDIVTGNENTECVGKGTVKLVEGKNVVTLNALHVPKLPYDLVATIEFWRKNYQVEFAKNPERCIISNKNLKFNADIENNLCKMRGNFKPAESALICSVKMWHDRLGHPNSKYTKSTVGETLDDSQFFCEICEMTKAKKLPFQGHFPTPKKPLEVIHTDLSGRINPPTNSGYEYYMKITDGLTSTRAVYLLKNKDEALSKLTEFKTKYENICESKIKTIVTDGGGEYCSNKFETYLKDNGIFHQITAPYTPEQNPISERGNRITTEKARAMLFQSGLPLSYWGEAVITAVYLENLIVSKAANMISPYEALTGRKPKITHLHPFGCLAIANIPKQQRKNKFAPTGTRCVLLGYSEGNNNYKLMEIQTKRIIFTHNATFNESVFPMKDCNSPKEMFNIVTISHTTETPTNQNVEDDEEFHDAVEEQIEEQSADTENPVTRRLILRLGPPPPENQSDQYSGPTLRSHTRKVINELEGTHNALINFVEQQNTDPDNYRKAISGSQRSHWISAIKEELDSLHENHVWCIVPANHQKTIPTRWIFKTKYDENGVLNKFKARLVIKGYLQRHGIDFNETFAPTGRLATLRTIFALAAIEGLPMHQLDIKTAFLNSNLDEDIFIQPPEGFTEWLDRSNLNCKKEIEQLNGGSRVLKLKKALYGLKQAPRAWYQEVSKWFHKHKFKTSNSDPCLFIRKDSNDDYLYVFIWVDDMAIIGHGAHQFHAELSKDFKVHDFTKATYLLGIQITRLNSTSVQLHQSQYIADLLETFGMTDCKINPTPMQSNIQLLPSDDDQYAQFLKTGNDYRSIIGSIGYLAQCTRPDITHAVNYLSQFLIKPNQSHWQAALRILRYLKGTANVGLLYSRDFKTLIPTKINISNQAPTGFSDADWAGCNLTRRSTNGYAFLLGGGAISWKSKKQNTVSTSATESEYKGYLDAGLEGVWLRKLLSELGYENNQGTLLYGDNQGAIALSKNPVAHKRTKHIEVHFNWVREKVLDGELNLKYCSTHDMVADIMTKALDRTKFEKFRTDLGLNECRRTIGSSNEVEC